jgi:hypothetical protein
VQAAHVSNGGAAGSTPTAIDSVSREAATDDQAGQETAGTIVVVRNPAVQGLLLAVPILVGLVLVAGGFYVNDPMFATGLGAVIVAFVMYHVFAHRIPEAFKRLRDREVIVVKDRSAYAAFEERSTFWLNHPGQIVAGLFGALAAFVRFPIQVGGLDRLFGSGPGSFARAGPIRLADIAGEMILGFAIGLVIWRMGITAWRISRLGGHFTLRLKLNHPDGCGGFRPLGDLCLLNASLLTVPAVYLATWIVLSPRIPRYAGLYTELHVVLLATVMVLATLAFIAPLWSIHGEMLRESARLRPEVDQVGQQIDRLSRQLLDQSGDLSADEAAAVAKDLDIRQANYKRIERIPTWPIDVNLALRFGTSQLIPLLSLTGLSGPIVDAIGRLGGFVAPSGG